MTKPMGCEVIFGGPLRLPDFYQQSGGWNALPEEGSNQDVFRIINGGLVSKELGLPSSEPALFQGWLRIAEGYNGSTSYEKNGSGQNFPITGIVTAAVFRRQDTKYKLSQGLDSVNHVSFSGYLWLDKSDPESTIGVNGVHFIGGREGLGRTRRYGWVRANSHNDQSLLRSILPD